MFVHAEPSRIETRREEEDNSSLIASIAWGLVAGIVKLAAAIVVAAAKYIAAPLLKWLGALLLRFAVAVLRLTAEAVKEMATGRHRGVFAPVWPLAVAALPLPMATRGWLAAASGVAAVWLILECVDRGWSLADALPGQVGPRLRHAGIVVRAAGRTLRWTWNQTVGRDILSRRELLIVAGYFSALAAWKAAGQFVPWWLSWFAVLPALTLYPVVLWVSNRRVRPAPGPTEFEVAWATVPSRIPEMAGQWTDFDPETMIGRWLLDDTLAVEVEDADRDVELALSHVLPDVRKGSLDLKHDPDDHVRALMVRYAPDPKGDNHAVQYFTELTLDRDGRYLAGSTPKGEPVNGRLWRDGGAAHTPIVATTGGGKGVQLRALLTEAIGSPHVFTVAVDGKGGTGMPWARKGVDIYAMKPEEWALAIELTYDVMEERKDRYAPDPDADFDGRDRWSPFVPARASEACDPLWQLDIDEIQRVVKEFPLRGRRALAKKVEDITAQGRSAGVSVVTTTQFGLAPEYWNNIIRTNLMGGGTTFVGKVGGRQAKAAAVQGVQGVDPNTLPDVDGWFLPISRIDDTVTKTRFRTRFLPTQADIDDGKHAPVGSAEEFIAKVARRAVLHPATLEIVESYRERFENAGAGFLIPKRSGTDSATPGESAAPEPATRPTLVAVPNLPPGPEHDASEDGASRVLRALKECDMNTSQLARATGLNRSYLSSGLLPTLAAQGKIARDEAMKWSAA